MNVTLLITSNSHYCPPPPLVCMAARLLRRTSMQFPNQGFVLEKKIRTRLTPTCSYLTFLQTAKQTGYFFLN